MQTRRADAAALGYRLTELYTDYFTSAAKGCKTETSLKEKNKTSDQTHTHTHAALSACPAKAALFCNSCTLCIY